MGSIVDTADSVARVVAGLDLQLKPRRVAVCSRCFSTSAAAAYHRRRQAVWWALPVALGAASRWVLINSPAI